MYILRAQIETQALSIKSSCKPHAPIYSLTFSYKHSSNGGKTLISYYETELKKPFNTFFDEAGRLVRDELERELRQVPEKAMDR